RDVFPAKADFPDKLVERRPPDVSLADVLSALRDVLRRAEMFSHHRVEREPLSVRERMSRVLETVGTDGFIEFTRLFSYEEGRRGVVVAFLAVLELIKESLIELVQNEPFGTIHVKARSAEVIRWQGAEKTR
ncbi:MAG: segregation/condensation protein A, partial [Chromatiales bacterium]